MKLQQQQPRPIVSENNLIPMINVVFLLLIFFMVAGMVRISDSLPLKAPESTNENPVIADSVLYVIGDGTMKLDNSLVTMESLGAALEVLQSKAPDRDIFSDNTSQDSSQSGPQPPDDLPLLAIKADALVTVSLLRDILKAARDAGLSRVELITSWVPIDN